LKSQPLIAYTGNSEEGDVVRLPNSPAVGKGFLTVDRGIEINTIVIYVRGTEDSGFFGDYSCLL
jgi:hypothetical protein